jgi:serine/threonine-protein kinase
MPLLHQISILCGVLSGLHHAHELCDFDGTPLRVVHRDVSPHNVFVTYDGHVKVVDFGIAKAAGAAAQTQQGAIKGKLAYMPPEQATGKQVDRRADIFAVGVMLWEALAGQRMWAAIPESGILFRLSTHDLPPLEDAAPDAPPQLLEIARKALAPSPDQRYETAAEMEAALSAYLTAQPQRVTPTDLGSYLSRHFEEQRARIKRAVEDQMREFREDRSSREIPVFPPSSEGPVSGFEAPEVSPTPTRPPALGPTPVAYHIAAPTLQSLPGPRPARGNPARKAAVLGFLCATIGVAGGVLVALRLTAPKTSQQPTPLANAPASSPGGPAQLPARPAASVDAPLASAPLASAPLASAPLAAPSASAHGAAPATGGPRHQDSPGKPSPKTPPPSDDRAAFGGRK